MDEKVASRRWSRGSSVAARATCSSAFLFVMDRKMQVSARGDNIGAAYPRAIRNGEHVARRPTCTEGQSEYPEGDSDTTRALQDRRQLATVSVFWTFFLVPRRMPPSPGGGRRERGALASTTAEGTRDTRVDLARVHPGGGREAATLYDEPTCPPRRATAPGVVTAETGISRDAPRWRVRAHRRAPLGWGRGRRYFPRGEKTCRRAGAVHRGR